MDEYKAAVKAVAIVAKAAHEVYLEECACMQLTPAYEKVKRVQGYLRERAEGEFKAITGPGGVK